ncbi:hypothetical protein E4U16_001158 [Claviceps sp. LM84 group G4]|nr:hypothetical protein E4U16_001158 [Claviceps sp. LM84 group G4]
MSVLDDMRWHFDAVSEAGTVSKNGTVFEVFEDGTEAIEEIEYIHETLGLHLLSAHDERYEAGIHPFAICADSVHYASAIPPYPISSDRYAYVIDTRQIDEADVKE